MKILLISNVFPPGFIGGYELGAYDVANGLVKKGHDVTVLTSHYFLNEEPVDFSFKVIRSLSSFSLRHQPRFLHDPVDPYYMYDNIRILRSTLYDCKPELVITFNLQGLGALSIVHFLKALKIPTILYLMDNIFSDTHFESLEYAKYRQYLGPLEYSNHMMLLSMSQRVIDEIQRYAFVPNEQLKIIPGWVDLKQEHAFKTHNVSPTIRFVFCSRIASHKGIQLILEASEQLVKAEITNFTIDFYGLGEVSDFLQAVNAKNLNNFLFYKGVINSKEKVLDVLSNYDALLFPTWERETFGFIAVEAAAVGCFPIMTSGIGVSEWFIDEYDCFKIQRTTDALKFAMLSFICLSHAERESYRNNAFTTGIRFFNFDDWLEEIENTCVDLVTKTKSYQFDDIRRIDAAFLCLHNLFAT